MKAAVIIASDKGYLGEREDLSGPAASVLLEEAGYDVETVVILPDEIQMLADKMREFSNQKINLIITTGGTGFSKRDVTPEATAQVIERQAYNISQALLMHSLSITPNAMLSRGIAGICKESLIINLPGSPKAVRESLAYVLPILSHGMEILRGTTSECGQILK